MKSTEIAQQLLQTGVRLALRVEYLHSDSVGDGRFVEEKAHFSDGADLSQLIVDFFDQLVLVLVD